MSGIYIKGMKMPTMGHTVTLTICADGDTIIEFRDAGKQTAKVEKYTSVPVPDHGRLIDANALDGAMWRMRAQYQMLDDTQVADKIMHGLYRAEQTIKEAPTVIPASEEAE